jgi:hypothetical protein
MASLISRRHSLRLVVSGSLVAVVLAGCGGKTKTVTVPPSGSGSTPSPAPKVEGVLAPTQYKPTDQWCPTNRTCLSHVVWATYTDTRAVGVGPGKECGGGGTGCRAYEDINVTLTDPRMACGKLRFTRLRMFENEFALDSLCMTYQAQ